MAAPSICHFKFHLEYVYSYFCIVHFHFITVFIEMSSPQGNILCVFYLKQFHSKLNYLRSLNKYEIILFALFTFWYDLNSNLDHRFKVKALSVGAFLVPSGRARPCIEGE